MPPQSELRRLSGGLIMSRYMFLAIISLIYSCQAATTAEITGHFENSDKKDLWASAHTQVVPPEWAESQSVVISMKTVTLAGVALPKALLDNVERLTIVQPHSDDPNEFAAERKLLIQELGSDFSRVEFVIQEPGVASLWTASQPDMKVKVKSICVTILRTMSAANNSTSCPACLMRLRGT